MTAGSGYVGWTWALEKSTSRNLHKMWVFTSAIKKTNYQQYGKYVAININILIILIHLLIYTGFWGVTIINFNGKNFLIMTKGSMAASYRACGTDDAPR